MQDKKPIEINKDHMIQSLQQQNGRLSVQIAERDAIISQLYEIIDANEQGKGDTNDKGRSVPHQGTEEGKPKS